MSENKYKIALEKFPELLRVYDDVFAAFRTLCEQIHSVCNFDYSIVYYINSEKLNVKSKWLCPFGYPHSLPITETVKKQLYEADFLRVGENFELQEVLNIPKDFYSDYVVLKLAINEVVYGFMLFAKKEELFSDEDIDILKAGVAVCSYAIKDNELSEVLKMQFKTLREDIMIKTESCKLMAAENQKILETDSIKNEFIAKLSHELRTPMNSIIGFAEILKNAALGELNQKQLNCVNDIHTSSIQLLGMINEVLDIAKLESNMMKLAIGDVDFSRLLTETVNTIKPLANKKKITISINEDVESVYRGDYRKLQQILFNLLSNAIKFTYNNGRIEVFATETESQIILRVKDNGIGIDPKYHGKIFGKFVQIENEIFNKESSTGLGLTITKELVRLHNGTIRLESKLNEGTEFIVELPKQSL